MVLMKKRKTQNDQMSGGVRISKRLGGVLPVAARGGVRMRCPFCRTEFYWRRENLADHIRVRHAREWDDLAEAVDGFSDLS